MSDFLSEWSQVQPLKEQGKQERKAENLDKDMGVYLQYDGIEGLRA